MNKQDLSAIIAKAHGISKVEATRCINMVVQGIIEALKTKSCKIIRVANFGSFHKRLINRRTVRNPKTGQTVVVGSYHQINFRASKQFKEAANVQLKTESQQLEEVN